jgi:hypothetical protein
MLSGQFGEFLALTFAVMNVNEEVSGPGRVPGGCCGEAMRLREALLAAIRELNALHSEQMRSVLDGDSDFSRFDLLVHMANERKDLAKYALLQHLESHRCEEI